MAAYLAEVVGFLLLLAFVWRYVAPPLRRAMDRREASISNAIASAAAARADAEAERARREELLEAARAEAEAIRAQAQASAEHIRAEGTRAGLEERDRVVAAAAAQIALERARARDEVARAIGDLVVELAAEVVAAELDAERQRRLVEEAILAAEGAAA